VAPVKGAGQPASTHDRGLSLIVPSAMVGE
jgi:hypothetical protein